MASAFRSRHEVDQALAAVLTMAGEPRGRGTRSPRRRRSWWVRLLRWIGPPLVFAMLPFVVLLRGATLGWLHGGWPPWLSVGVAALGAGLVVFAGTAWLVRRLGGSLPRYGLRVSVLLAAAYAAFALLYVSADNVKRPEIRETYRALHPLLRLSVSTLVLVDSDQIITDAARAPEDYGDMGLAVNPTSLHYRQADGFVHAVDLRTIGRSDLSIAVTSTYFRLVGFRVLRHTGTADHLHVSMPYRVE